MITNLFDTPVNAIARHGVDVDTGTVVDDTDVAVDDTGTVVATSTVVVGITAVVVVVLVVSAVVRGVRRMRGTDVVGTDASFGQN